MPRISCAAACLANSRRRGSRTIPPWACSTDAVGCVKSYILSMSIRCRRWVRLLCLLWRRVGAAVIQAVAPPARCRARQLATRGTKCCALADGRHTAPPSSYFLATDASALSTSVESGVISLTAPMAVVLPAPVVPENKILYSVMRRLCYWMGFPFGSRGACGYVKLG